MSESIICNLFLIIIENNVEWNVDHGTYLGTEILEGWSNQSCL